MTADMVPAARPRRRHHFHNLRSEGTLGARAHSNTLPRLGRSVPYTPHFARQDESNADNASPSPSPSNNNASPTGHDEPSSPPDNSTNDTLSPSTADAAPSPSEDANVDSQTTEKNPHTARQTPEWTEEPTPTPPQTQDNTGSSSEDTDPVPSSTWSPEPTDAPPTPDPTPSSDPSPLTTLPEPAPAPSTSEGGNQPAAEPTTAWVQEPLPSSSQEWRAPAPTQETLWSDAPAASAQSPPPAAQSSSEVVAGVLSGAASSSPASAARSAATVAVGGIATSRSATSAASGATLTTPKAQPTVPGVTASQPRAVSPSSNASNSAEAASAAPESGSLSGGAKAGIAIGVLAAVGAALFLVFFCIRRRKRSNNIVGSTARSANPYAFSGYGAAQEKGGASDLRRNGTQHSALDFSDGPLPNQRSRWRHLSTLAVPFSTGRSRASVGAGPGMAGVGSNPSRLDSTNPSFDHSNVAYPYARSESDDDHNEVLQAVDDDASRFRNTHYEEWLAYDRAGVFDPAAGSPTSPDKAAAGANPKLRQPQARRVPVPQLDPDPFADSAAAQADAAPSPTTPTGTAGTPVRPPPSRARTLDNMYGIYTEDEPVVQHLPYRVTPPPVQAQAQQFAQPQSAMLGHAV